jgi:Undecaprenyl-phosphate glucose phosphotransferase
MTTIANSLGQVREALGRGIPANKSLPGQRLQAAFRSGEVVPDNPYCPTVPTNKGKSGRWAISYRGISQLVAFTDVAIIVTAATISGLAYHFVAFGDPGDVTRDFAVSVFVATFFVFVTYLRKFYDPTELLIWNNQLQNVLLTWGCTFIFLGGLVFSLGASKEASRGAILWFAMSGAAGLLLHRFFWRMFIARALAAGSLSGRRVVVIGWDSSESVSQFIVTLRRHGFQIVRQFAINDSSQAEFDGCLARAISFVRGSDIEEIYLLSRPERLDGVNEVIEHLRLLPVPVTLIPNAATAELVRHSWHQLGHLIAIEVQRPPLSIYERAVKRSIDMLVAFSGLVMLAPLLAIVAIAIKMDTSGPILFRQTRRGFNGKRFKIFKFRSMTVLEDGATIKQATATDDRVTRVGAFIRKSSIDEFPQLLNVLRGEMSIVGPRPHAVAHDDYFTRQIENYAFRHHVKPGITGWAQVQGHRGETKTLSKMQQRVECDLWYINNWSIWLDISILLRTFSEVIRGENAY